MERNTEFIFAIFFAVSGISHILRPQVWIDFFARCRAAGSAGVFIVAILHLVPAMLILSLHPHWNGAGAVLTAIGWGWMIKASLYLVFPAVGIRTLSLARPDRPMNFVIGGVALLVVSGVLAASALT